MLTLCFDREANYLGEMLTENGSLKHWTLTQAGEKAFGAHMMLWQTRGVPVNQQVAQKDYRTYVPLRSPECLDALRRWAAENEITMVDLEPNRLRYWEHLLRLPFSPPERLAMLLTIRSASESDLAEWKRLLESAELSGVKGQAHALRSLEKFKRKVGSVGSKMFVEKHGLKA